MSGRARTADPADRDCAARQLSALEELTQIARSGSRLAIGAIVMLVLSNCVTLWRSESRFFEAERSRVSNASNTTVLSERSKGLDARLRTVEDWKYVIQQREHDATMDRVRKAREAQAAETP